MVALHAKLCDACWKEWMGMTGGSPANLTRDPGARRQHCHPREALGGPWRPSEALGRPREAQGSPGKPREALGGPWEAQGGPGRSREVHGTQICSRLWDAIASKFPSKFTSKLGFAYVFLYFGGFARKFA